MFQITLIFVWALYNRMVKFDLRSNGDTIIWSICCMSINVAVCVLGWWRCFANNYLHYAAVCTWLLLTLQSKSDGYFTIFKFTNGFANVCGKRTNERFLQKFGFKANKRVSFFWFPKFVSDSCMPLWCLMRIEANWGEVEAAVRIIKNEVWGSYFKGNGTVSNDRV